ncbi:MAG TPA: DUF2059 domain-containing protein [Acidobacteriota bacterium]|nr:DUF2059 domain-containing protein [Acidobacteriota bacterium]
MPRLTLTFLSILWLLSAPAWGYQGSGQDGSEGPPQDISAERWEAAQELLRVTEVAEMMQKVTDQQLQEQLAASPEMAQYEDVIQEFFHRYLTWETFKEPFTRIYAETFTTQELRELIAFYRTPTGQRFVQVQTEIVQKSSRLGQQVIEEHQGELMRAIQERAMELAAQQPGQGQAEAEGSHEHGSRSQGGRIILLLPGAEVAEISSEELAVLDRKGERQILVMTEDTSIQDEDGFPVEDQLQDEQGQWDEQKLQEFLPAGSKVQVQYFVRGQSKVAHLIEKSN